MPSLSNSSRGSRLCLLHLYIWCQHLWNLLLCPSRTRVLEIFDSCSTKIRLALISDVMWWYVYQAQPQWLHVLQFHIQVFLSVFRVYKHISYPHPNRSLGVLTGWASVRHLNIWTYSPGLDQHQFIYDTYLQYICVSLSYYFLGLGWVRTEKCGLSRTLSLILQ